MLFQLRTASSHTSTNGIQLEDEMVKYFVPIRIRIPACLSVFC